MTVFIRNTFSPSVIEYQIILSQLLYEYNMSSLTHLLVNIARNHLLTSKSPCNKNQTKKDPLKRWENMKITTL